MDVLLCTLWWVDCVVFQIVRFMDSVVEYQQKDSASS